MAAELKDVNTYDPTTFLPTGVLSRQTSLLISVFETSDEAIVVADESGRLIFFNPAARRIYPRGVTAAKPQDWAKEYSLFLSDRITPYPPHRLPLIRALSGETVMDTEIFVKNPGNPEGIFLLVNARPIVEPSGKFVGAVSISRDITAFKEQQEQLALSEEKFRLAFEEGAFGLAMANQSLRFVRANRTFAKLLGYTPEEVLGLRVGDITHPEDQFRSADCSQSVTSGEKPSYTMEKRYVRKDGSLFWGKVTVTAVWSTSHQFMFFLSLLEDITLKKLADERARLHALELARSNSELEQFAYAASHDLKEPLRMVSMFANLLKQRYFHKLDDEADQYIFFATDAVHRMYALIDGILEYARVGRAPRQVTRVNLNRVIEIACANLKVSLEESGGTVDFQKLPPILGDEALLVQLFQNLIGNSLKFRGTRLPVIKISATEQTDHWLLGVQDNGIGISAESTERIFKLFHRLHTREEYPGSGVGLAICKKIVESLNGLVWAESVPNVGSTFFVRLPKELSQVFHAEQFPSRLNR